MVEAPARTLLQLVEQWVWRTGGAYDLVQSAVFVSITFNT
jgi:hypothetical protein